MNRVSQIKYSDKTIVQIDLSNAEEEDIVEAVNTLIKYLKKSGTRSHLLLTDVTNSYIFGSRFNYAKDAMKTIRPYTSRRAMIGLSDSKKILLRTANVFAGGSPTSVFSTKEEALEYLVRKY